MFTTRNLAAAVRVSEQAVRDYEAGGLLPSVPRQANGYRAFSVLHLAALHVIRGLKEAAYLRKEMVTIMVGIHQGSLSPGLAILDDHHHRLWVRRTALMQSRESESSSDLEETGESAKLSIGKVARHVGVNTSTLRFWESVGVIRVERNPSNGFRQFGQTDLARVAAVKRMRALGVPWDAIREELLTPRAPCAEDASQRESSIIDDIDRQSWLNARATAMVYYYGAIYVSARPDILDDLMRGFIDSLLVMNGESQRDADGNRPSRTR